MREALLKLRQIGLVEPNGRRGGRVPGRVRKRIEEHFGWGKTVGRIRQTVYRGLKRVDQQFKLTMTASNIVRLARIMTSAPQGALQ